MFQEMMVAGGTGGSVDLGTLNPLIPRMTSRTAPSGAVTSSSIYNGTYDNYTAFVGQQQQYGWLPSSAGVGWIQYAFPSGVTNVAKLLVIQAIFGNDVDISAVKGSLDGTNFDTITTNLHITNYQFNAYDLSNSKAYNTYRVEFSNLTTNGQGCHIQLFGE